VPKKTSKASNPRSLPHGIKQGTTITGEPLEILYFKKMYTRNEVIISYRITQKDSPSSMSASHQVKTGLYTLSGSKEIPHPAFEKANCQEEKKIQIQIDQITGTPNSKLEKIIPISRNFMEEEKKFEIQKSKEPENQKSSLKIVQTTIQPKKSSPINTTEPFPEYRSNNYPLLKSYLQNHDMEERFVYPDGNCFPTCIDYLLYDGSLSQSSIRFSTAEYIEHLINTDKDKQESKIPKNLKEIYPNPADLQSFIDSIKKNGIFFDHIAIQACANFYILDITIIDDQGRETHICAEEFRKKNRFATPIWLIYYCENKEKKGHYTMATLKKPSNSHAKLQAPPPIISSSTKPQTPPLEPSLEKSSEIPIPPPPKEDGSNFFPPIEVSKNDSDAQSVKRMKHYMQGDFRTKVRKESLATKFKENRLASIEKEKAQTPENTYFQEYHPTNSKGRKICKNCRGRHKEDNENAFLVCNKCKAYIHHYCSYLPHKPLEEAQQTETYCKECIGDNHSKKKSKIKKGENPIPADESKTNSPQTKEKMIEEKKEKSNEKKGNEKAQEKAQKGVTEKEKKNESKMEKENLDFFRDNSSKPPPNSKGDNRSMETSN